MRRDATSTLTQTSHILDHDIEDHADEADAKGLKVKKLKFTWTKHVEHMRTDPERYWGAVKGTWDVRA
ncbi:hypothetical protein V1508DRAFT_412089 [Lipomyces doorenjongii]|uniref:uncharacterized protein n=1 Tax=Lipomyces doorenjongii TaxID=383834 RepID=UPI0034CE06AD